MGNSENKKKEEEKEEEKKEEKIIIKIIEKKETINEFEAINDIPKFQKYEEETEYLSKKKKKVLESQLWLVKEELKKYKDINEVIEQFNKTEEVNINNKSILDRNENDKYCCCSYIEYLKWNFNFIGLLFVIFNLIGVYQLIWIYKATRKEMINGMKNFLFKKNNPENNYENYMFSNFPDFNLIFLSSMFGNIFLKSFGFIFSSILFMIINSFIIFFFNSFNFKERKYDFYKILELFIYFFLIFIGVGSVSLFAHQIYFDGLRKYLNYRKGKNKVLEEENENDENKENIKNNENKNDNESENIEIKLNEKLINQETDNDNIINENNKTNILKKKKSKPSFFSYLCFTIIPSYLINVGINFILKVNNFFDKFFLMSILIYIICTVISIIIYCIYLQVFINEKKNQEIKDKEIKIFRLFGYIIYCEKKIQKYKKEDNKINNNNITNKEENEDIIIKNTNNNDNKSYNDCCYSLRLGLRKFYHKSHEKKSIHFTQCLSSENCKEGECCICFCCCNICCSSTELSEINQGDEQFCYCYKVQRKFSWCCDLLFKNEILDLILFDIFLEILTIGFEKKLNKKLNQNLENNKFKTNFITLIIYLLFFLFCAFYNRIEKVTDCSFESFFKDIDKTKEFDNQMISFLVLGFFDFFFVTILSGFSSYGNEELKNFTDNYLIIIPFALTKFYNFVLLNCLVNIIDDGNIDILSNSIIVSSFLMSYSFLRIFIIDILLDISAEKLILFQFIFGISIIVIIIILFILAIIVAYICVKLIKAFCNCIWDIICEKLFKKNKN